ncbi:uroporphyrinogen-III C-methyltransferase [Herbaspirillum sp. C7C2]|uniref:uroporphyrinogen-III C-methyltransferase n=2 Tax=Oxalobacteraceae TaxID=75682 RepID=UPI001F529D06|nr:uroporphyrinogen-III C-methyltransferase [Herbaspirillum sp. C7C2]MCI1015844.1 uroporphyrinogen-III C-methyltransferase [Herbaspirillum sp. C7C2]
MATEQAANPSSSDSPAPSPDHPGQVWLIGSGPGAADLLTVRAARLLAQADIVLHDALVTEEILALCPQAVQVSVGKRSGQRSTAQPVINQKLVEAAQQYRRVVRLKGGDPMLFGRADEEMRALEEHHIPYEIVPGITAALAAASAAKRPLTRRGIARSVSLFTSSTGVDEPDEVRMPNGDTLVQYMGGREATATAQRLLALGHAPDTPVVVVENCSRPDQHIYHLQLAGLEAGLQACSGPVLVMIGPALADRE